MDGVCSYTYDSANRLKSFGGHTYTYTSADIRIRNLCADEDTTYTYDTNSKLSKLLTKTTNGTVTKYVYGRGLIGEQTGSAFKTYHFDFRGSTVAITDANGNITDTFAYDTYGNLASRTGTSKVIFLYNGRDGVVADDNGLYYMRARYYSPEMRRFVNADIVAGQISNAVTLNRFAYANGNPVSFVDPFGLSADTRSNNDTPTSGYYTAVLVTRLTKGEGIPYLGHTQLYFVNENGKWYMSEFNTTRDASGIREKKNKAQIWFDQDADVSAFYDPVIGFKDNPDGLNYVVLSGNFDESVQLAMSYNENQNFGRYNFLYHNCCDYTNKLLDVANIDGFMGQTLANDLSIVSIPSIREIELSIATKIDSISNAASEGLRNLGNSLDESNLVGDILVGAGSAINAYQNMRGDVTNVAMEALGVLTDVGKTIGSTISNGIYDFVNGILD